MQEVLYNAGKKLIKVTEIHHARGYNAGKRIKVTEIHDARGTV
jgi:hypothetical protein